MIVYIVLMAYLLLIASFVLKNHVRVITLRGLGKPRQIRDNIACCLLTAIPLIVFLSFVIFTWERTPSAFIRTSILTDTD